MEALARHAYITAGRPASTARGEMCGAPATSRRAAECSDYIVGLAKLPPSATRP